ncbi:unnamed protein product [Auanema sp. JU1783]|nr:unnamed protein product [Auanema sp. JU1783]
MTATNQAREVSEINETFDFSYKCFKMVKTLQSEIGKAINVENKVGNGEEGPGSVLPHTPFDFDPFTTPCCSYMTPNWVEPGSQNTNANDINYRTAATESLFHLEKKVNQLNLPSMRKTKQAINEMRSLLEKEF